MQPFIARLRRLPRWQIYATMTVLITAVIVATTVVLVLPTTPDLSALRGASAGLTSTSKTPPPGAINLPDTTNGIHVGLVFDSLVPDLNSLQGKIDIVWGATKAQSVPGAFTIAYNPSERVGNGVIGPLYSTDWFQQHHPDWIVYKCDRATPAFGFGEANTPIDITNPDVQQFVLQQEIIPQIKAGYQAIGFDNVGFTNVWERCGHFDAQHHWVQLYAGTPQDPQYQQSIIDWGKRIYTLIKGYAPYIKVSMNFSFDYTHRAFWSQMLPYVDILTDEGGFTNFGSPGFPFLTDEAWKSYIDFMQRYQTADPSHGLFILNEAGGSTVSSGLVRWALANYLLIKRQHTYVTVVGHQAYGRYFDFSEYRLAIGAPRGDYTTDGCLYQRQYSGGLVLVNPASRGTCTITFPHAYKTLAGAMVTSLTVSPYTGVILLN